MITIGLMSGTSVDGIDAALCEFDDHGDMHVLHTLFTAYPTSLKEQIHRLCNDASPSTAQLEAVDKELVESFAGAVRALLGASGTGADEVSAIGSHGQTIRHCPDCNPPYSLQIGMPQALARATGIKTIGDFRSADIQVGGQGAPLAPGFHNAVFRSRDANRIILNIGGIANITSLPANPRRPVTGFDTGPGNTLIDAWVRQSRQQDFDVDGQWAAGGRVIPGLLERMRDEAYFRQSPPKSTGRELFSSAWLQRQLADYNGHARDQDIAATLVALTTSTIIDAIKGFAADTDEVYVCGGGAHNALMMRQLKAGLDGPLVTTTAELGIDPDWVEASAFAWLARQTLLGLPGNLPEVTGARQSVILGTAHSAAS